METKIYSVDELKDLFIQTLLNKTNKISKISDNSVLNAVAFGTAKVFQKSMKDTALLESELFPEYAYGEYLDKIALRSGVAPRQKNIGSSVWLRLVGVPGSFYDFEKAQFSTNSGYIFKLDESVSVPDSGYIYVKAKSIDTGSGTSVGANTIVNASGVPEGHLYVTNEVPAQGGVDIESDQSVLNRLLQNFNNFAFDTLGRLRSVFMILNPLVLDVKKIGIDSKTGKVKLGIVTVNGTDLTSEELDFLLKNSVNYLSLTDVGSFNEDFYDPNIILQMVDMVETILDFRVDLYESSNIDELRTNILIQVTKFFDFRTWSPGKTIQWEDIYYIARNQPGIKSIPSETFYFSETGKEKLDVKVPSNKYPVLKGFVMRGMDGSILPGGSSTIIPYYYSSDYYPNVFEKININNESKG